MTADPSLPHLDRAELIQSYASLVRMIASKIAHRLPPNVELDDLISSGTIGLIDAIDKFDQAKSANFKKYAEIRIKGAILDELRVMDRETRTVRRQTNTLDRLLQELQRDLGRQASEEEVAERLGTDLEGYHRILNKLRPISVVSFEDLGGGRSDAPRDPMQFLADPTAVDPHVVLHVKRLRDLVASLIDRLKERERLVVSLYYYDDMNLKEIGRVLGVTESRISQILKEAVTRLKGRIRAHLAREAVDVKQLD